MVPSPTYFQLFLEFVRGVCWPPHSSTLGTTFLGRDQRSNCGASLWNVKISDLDFAVDAVIFVEILDALIGALEALNEELEPPG